MIVFASFMPHPPLLVPTIGKQIQHLVQKTAHSYQRLVEELYAAKPDTILIISPHGQQLADAFTFNMAPSFTVSFKEFGDLATTVDVTGDVGLIHRYKEKLEASIPVIMLTQPELDHGIGVPLYFINQAFGKNLPQLIPLYPSSLENQAHYDFGVRLQNEIMNDTKRIALIASGDLSHRLTESAPGGYSHWAQRFDEAIKEKIERKDHKGLVGLDPDFIDEAGECGLRPLIMLLGMLNNVNYRPEVYSYEAPFGVGYLAAQFHLR